MKVILTVWEDGLWRATGEDASGALAAGLAKGTWSRTRGKIVAESDGPSMTKAARERDIALCQAVCSVVTAMKFKGGR